jgi:hypothetical protein
LPVSFSTIEARMIACSGVVTAMPGFRFAQAWARYAFIAVCMRATTDWRVSPRWKA